MNKLNVVLMFGGESSEHDVSIMSARNVYEALDKTAYEVSLCYIPRSGEDWLLVPSLDDLTGPRMSPLLGRNAFSTVNGELPVDVIFPVLHGKHGEDGEVQGLASLMHVACVGPSLIGAAVTMDKDVTKHLLENAGVPVVQWATWQVGQPLPGFEALEQTLGSIMFVKPANAGSSVGVSKVTNQDELSNALQKATSHDKIVLIERAIDAREIELAVLGNQNAMVTTPGEIVPGEEFYSYDDKYSESSASVVHIPADLSDDTAAKLKQMALVAYHATRGKGMARIDFFITPVGEIYCNEINALPGFTNISMYPKLWEHDGVTQSELVNRLIAAAME